MDDVRCLLVGSPLVTRLALCLAIAARHLASAAAAAADVGARTGRPKGDGHRMPVLTAPLCTMRPWRCPPAAGASDASQQWPAAAGRFRSTVNLRCERGRELWGIGDYGSKDRSTVDLG
ncbi:hypothetical protein U9M48_025159 [Paspalum notatum var. saurae]|uniref:Secreted protein n=1 Tax=Paspalum notatum var. saurae TaxID=547442 RepID=A0AAQ3TSQ3_PASNO